MKELKINFTPYFNKIPIQCGQALSLQDQDWQILAFSMFLSEFSLDDPSVVILDDNDWQSQQVALIRAVVDCEQRSANMSVIGSIQSDAAELNKAITLNFNIGLPFELNHRNPLIQASPLNDSSMFWAWRNGYKFIRWDMQAMSAGPADSGVESTVNNSWSFHLGSIGCESAAMVRAPKQACTQANVVPISVDLDERSVSKQLTEEQKVRLVLNVELHLDEIIANMKLTRASTCMFSGIDSRSCKELLENLKHEPVFR